MKIGKKDIAKTRFKVTFQYKMEILAENEQEAIEKFADYIDGNTIVDNAEAEVI